MMPNKTPLAALAALFLTLPAQAGKLDDWYKLLPQDTIGIIAVKSSPEMMADWDKSGLGLMMEDEEFQRWAAPMMKDGDAPWDAFFKEHSGESLRENLTRYPGASLAAFIASSPEQLEKGLAFVALSEVGDNRAKLEEMKAKEKELMLANDEEVKSRVVELAGEQVEVLSKSDEPEALWETGFAFVGDALVEGNSQALMEQMIVAVKNGVAEPSATITGHLARLDALSGGTPDLRIYLNGEKLMQWAVQAARDFGASAAKGSPLPVSPDQVIEALGLEELQALSLMLNMQDEQSTFDIAVLHADQPTGLISLMRGGAGGEVELPGFVPADVISASAMRFSVVGLWDKLLAMVEKFGPAAAMLTGQLAIHEQQIGIKLRDDLFASLDDQYYELTDGQADAPSQVIAIKIKDKNRLGGAIEGIKRLVGAGFGAFDESEYLGHTILTLKTAQAQEGASAFAFCVADEHLLMSTGPQTLLRDVLARMKEPSGPSLWEDAKVRELLGRLPPGHVGLGVTDGSRVMKMMVDAIGMARSGMAAQKKGKGPKGGAAKSGDDTGDSYFDPAAAPSAEMWARYFGKGATGTYNPADAMHFRLLTVPAEAQ